MLAKQIIARGHKVLAFWMYVAIEALDDGGLRLEDWMRVSKAAMYTSPCFTFDKMSEAERHLWWRVEAGRLMVSVLDSPPKGEEGIWYQD